MLKDLLVEHDASEYYGTTKLEQRSRSPSPTTSLQNIASQQRFFRPCSRATGSAAAAALGNNHRFNFIYLFRSKIKNIYFFIKIATAAGGFLGLIGRRLPPTPRASQGMPIIQPQISSTGIPLMDTMTDSSLLPQPSTPTTICPMISPTTLFPRGISSYSLASLGGAVTPSLTKKQILRQLDDSIINFPSVSQSPTIPNQANRSPNSINFPKVNASPTHHIQVPVHKGRQKRTKQTNSSNYLNAGEETHLLDAQIDNAMIVDPDDLENLGLLQDECLNVGVDSAITNTTSTCSTIQWSNTLMQPQVTNSIQSTMIASGYPQQLPNISSRELPSVPMTNIPVRPSQQMTNLHPQTGNFNQSTVYLMPETQNAINMSTSQMPGVQIPMNLQNPNYLTQRILPSTAVYKTGRNPIPLSDDLNQW